MKHFLLLLLIIINCTLFEDKDRKREQSILLFDALVVTQKTGEKAEVIDNKDGTLNYTYITWTSSFLGYSENRGKTILVRRCLIGQVYRPEQNDCRGTGTETDSWGVIRYEWCPTNDTSCETNGIADPTKSPAAKACADDTFLGKKWELPSMQDSMELFMFKDNYILTKFYSWTKNSYSDTKAWAFLKDSFYFTKNQKGVVLCTIYL
jgi:hypothetical protein